MTTIRQLGEREVIRRIAPLLPGRADVLTGVGDDCAVVRGDDRHDLLYTTDAVIEGRHFHADTTPELIGRKAAARAISDIAAMGGEPAHLLVDLVAPPDVAMERIERIYRGLCGICAAHGVAVIGGDTAAGGVLELHVFLAGRVPRGGAVLRSGARPDDIVYVTGSLGGSLRGKHLDFEPRVEQGTWLRAGAWARAMIDVSDGLATDLRHILAASRVSALLDATRIPVSPDAHQAGGPRTPVEHALYDGEDFELLFTVPGARSRAFEAAWRAQFPLACTPVGCIEPGNGTLQLIDAAGAVTDLPDAGYEHFREV